MARAQHLPANAIPPRGHCNTPIRSLQSSFPSSASAAGGVQPHPRGARLPPPALQTQDMATSAYRIHKQTCSLIAWDLLKQTRSFNYLMQSTPLPLPLFSRTLHTSLAWRNCGAGVSGREFGAVCESDMLSRAASPGTCRAPLGCCMATKGVVVLSQGRHICILLAITAHITSVNPCALQPMHAP